MRLIGRVGGKMSYETVNWKKGRDKDVIRLQVLRKFALWL